MMRRELNIKRWKDLMKWGEKSVQTFVCGFVWNGERAKRIKVLEQRVYAEDQTQLFIETPYRNNKMAEDILKNCRPQTKLCIAANITCEGEYIKTKTIKEWQGKLPDLSKIPCIFLIYK